MSNPPAVHFLFPGHGSERPHMGRDLYDHIPSFRQDLDQCFEWVRAFSGFELKPILFPESMSDERARRQLSQTVAAQPALFSIEYCLSRLLKQLGIEPSAMLGHSVSEYVAACLAGVFTPESAMQVICKRGQLVQSLPEGSMLAIRLSEQDVQRHLGNTLDLGSTLASDRCVASGAPYLIDQLASTLEQEGVEVKAVKVTRAYHSRMLDPILEAFGEFVETISLKAPNVPFISGPSGRWITAEEATSPNYWISQLRNPVRLFEGFQCISESGSSLSMEVGCGTLLSSLAQVLEEFETGHDFVSTLPSFHQKISDQQFLYQEIQKVEQAGCHLRSDSVETIFKDIIQRREEETTDDLVELDFIEEEIAEVFRSILGLDRLRLEDNFLELGGNSLMAMKVITRLRHDFDYELSLKSFFTYKNLGDLIEHVSNDFASQTIEDAALLIDSNEASGQDEGTVPSTRDREMKFSLFFFSGDEDAEPEDPYRSVLESARFADKHQFDAIWIPERHFNKFGGLYPNPAVLGAAIAATTEHVHIRAGSVVAPLHHPVRIAEEWSALDNLSKGRVGVSFGSGFHPKDFLLAPDHFADRKNVMFDTINTIHSLWRGENLTAPSGEQDASTVRIYPTPFSDSLPTWLSTTRSIDTFTEAGQLGYNVLTALLRLTHEELKERISLYRATLTKAGFSAEEKKVTLMLHTFVGPDMEYVESQVKGVLKEYLRSHMEHTEAVAKEKEGHNTTQLTTEEEEELLEHAYKRYLEENSLIGTVESCQKTIEKLTALGVDEVACLIDFGISDEAMQVGLEHLAQLQQTCRATLIT